jgi:uncharacterized protein (DUF3820 family)
MSIICEKCGHHNGFAPSIEPAEFTLPFGKYKGHKLSDIVKKDLNYLKWMAGVTTSNNLKRKIESLTDVDGIKK